ncbi:rRNA dimethyltransferase, putative [Bodo saltans]|uniref:rRNA dimethyltransferase, putative n=1 Tax=Bodo saltans TaxID=75058 RepID=A0A0S4INB5_BODSA|nr:rRNA dimethyltransferase, putative [Bodo saltans]|eukprot:CUF63288.1 rRNA dimethyltransferase, putative [Bodo saltans]
MMSSMTTFAATIPVFAFYELILIAKQADLSLSTQAQNTVGTQSASFDYSGGLIATTAPEITDMYLPVGTPGAVCLTVVFNHKNISKCRHSMATMRPLWPLMFAAYAAITSHVDGVVQGPINTASYTNFEFAGHEFLVSASFPAQSNYAGIGWWTPTISSGAAQERLHEDFVIRSVRLGEVRHDLVGEFQVENESLIILRQVSTTWYIEQRLDVLRRHTSATGTSQRG